MNKKELPRFICVQELRNGELCGKEFKTIAKNPDGSPRDPQECPSCHAKADKIVPIERYEEALKVLKKIKNLQKVLASLMLK